MRVAFIASVVCLSGLASTGCINDYRCADDGQVICRDGDVHRVDSCGNEGDLVAVCVCGCDAAATGCLADCPDGSEPCPSGCNWECDKAAGLVCDPNTRRCAPGDPPDRCVSDCDCFSREVCVTGVCISEDLLCDSDADCDPSMGCVHGMCVSRDLLCESDDDCPIWERCVNRQCENIPCFSNEDCVGPVCLICRAGACTESPAVCQGDHDCCVGYGCIFGTCIPDGDPECWADSDCLDPDFPRCSLDTGECVPECVTDIDCPLPGYICIDTHCVTPGCTPEQCAQGEYCDPASGDCLIGCDSNDDCQPPSTCDYGTHVCGQVDCCGGVCSPGDRLCEPLLCMCVDVCQDAADCPYGFGCDPATGKCLCADPACPAGTHCDQASGECVRSGDECNPLDPNSCPAGTYCDPNQRVCVSQGGGDEGDACFTDGECDAGQGLLCDSDFYCLLCEMDDPAFDPTFTCRYECSWLDPDCPQGQTCKIRRQFFGMLCAPDG